MSRSYDGHPVEENLARLTGTFPVDAHDAEFLLGDSTVVAVVVARVVESKPQIMKRTGQVRRTDVLDVRQFAIVHESELQELLRKHLPQLESPSLEELPRVVEDDESSPTENAWIPPPAVRQEDPELAVAEDEVFTPAQDDRFVVGGARRNDALLRRFLDGADR